MNRSLADNATAILEVSGLSKSYRGKQALVDSSFRLEGGSLTAILGPAGAGKTTTLRLIAGLERPDSGEIRLAGVDALGLQPKDRDIAMIFDNIALYPNKSGFENIASPLAIRKVADELVEEQVRAIAKMLKISNVLNRLPKTMSGGERQRVALGRALIRSPQLFLLDEPLSSLDAKLRIELRSELRRLQRELGYTFLMATPDFTEAMAVADRIIMLREGRIVQVAAPQELYDNPVDTGVATFIGAPPINIVPAQVQQGGNGPQLWFGGSSIALPMSLTRLVELPEPAIVLGIRPENIILAPPGQGGMTGRLSDIEPLGLQAVLTVQLADIELRMTIKTAEAASLTVGEELVLAIANSERLLAFSPESGKRL